MAKILLVTFSENADHQDTLFGMYEQLAATHDVTLLTVKDPKVPLERSERTWLMDCPPRPGVCAKTFDLPQLARIIRRVRRARFDAVYFESLHVWNLPIMLAVKRRAHTYQVVHEVIPHEGDAQEKGVDFMNRVVCRLADTVVLRSRRYRETMSERYGIAPERVQVLELWRRYPPFSEPACSGKILFFGRINPYKGALALKEIAEACPELPFEVIGRVDEQMRSAAEALRALPNVSLTDSYVSDAEMRDAFQRCDWVILPYSSASQSGVIIDAYKYARPVIAFDVGAVSEQVDDGRSGYLVRAGDTARFAETLRAAAAMPEAEYRAMCENAYRYGTEKYAASGAAERFLSLIAGETL